MQSDEPLPSETREDIGLVVSTTHIANHHVNDMMMLIKLRDGNIVSQAEPTLLYSAVADVVAKFDDMVVAHSSPATQLPRCRLFFVPPVPEIVCIDIPNLQFILTKVLLWAASQVVGLRDSASVAVVVSLDADSGRKQIKFEVFDNGMSFGGATVEALLAGNSTIPKVCGGCCFE